jgi:hypothetical protein
MRSPPTKPTPTPPRVILRTQRRSLQMVLRLLAFNAEAWLVDCLNAYLHHLGGTITYTTPHSRRPRPIT